MSSKNSGDSRFVNNDGGITIDKSESEGEPFDFTPLTPEEIKEIEELEVRFNTEMEGHENLEKFKRRLGVL